MSCFVWCWLLFEKFIFLHNFTISLYHVYGLLWLLIWTPDILYIYDLLWLNKLKQVANFFSTTHLISFDSFRYYNQILFWCTFTIYSYLQYLLHWEWIHTVHKKYKDTKIYHNLFFKGSTAWTKKNLYFKRVICFNYQDNNVASCIYMSDKWA